MAGVVVNMKRADTRPQVIMIRPIHIARPDSVQNQVARHFEEKVADEEHPGAQTRKRFR